MCLLAKIKVEVVNRDQVDWSKPYIIMSNHQSLMDIPILYQSFPVSVTSLTKKRLKHIPIFGWCMNMGGYVFIDRKKRESAIESLRRAGQKVLAGQNILVFPEGTRNATPPEILPFKKGGFIMAITCGIPILPVVIKGMEKILPKGCYGIRAGLVTVQFGQEISTDKYSIEERDQLMDSLQKEMSALLGIKKKYREKHRGNFMRKEINLGHLPL